MSLCVDPKQTISVTSKSFEPNLTMDTKTEEIPLTQPPTIKIYEIDSTSIKVKVDTMPTIHRMSIRHSSFSNELKNYLPLEIEIQTVSRPWVSQMNADPLNLRDLSLTRLHRIVIDQTAKFQHIHEILIDQLQPSYQYTVKARTINANGWSLYSNPVDIFLPPDIFFPPQDAEIPAQQDVTRVITNTVQRDPVSESIRSPFCICGSAMTKYEDALSIYPKNGVFCDACSLSGNKNETFWHCEKERNSCFHPSGYDLCVICAAASKKIPGGPNQDLQWSCAECNVSAPIDLLSCDICGSQLDDIDAAVSALSQTRYVWPR